MNVQLLGNLRPGLIPAPQLFNTSHQFLVPAELFVASHRTNDFVLTDKAAAPMNCDIDTLALTLDIHNDSVNKMANDYLTVRGGCARCVPQSRYIR